MNTPSSTDCDLTYLYIHSPKRKKFQNPQACSVISLNVTFMNIKHVQTRLLHLNTTTLHVNALVLYMFTSFGNFHRLYIPVSLFTRCGYILISFDLYPAQHFILDTAFIFGWNLKIIKFIRVKKDTYFPSTHIFLVRTSATVF